MQTTEMIDVAAGYDERGITIQQVGVTDVHVPIRIRRKEGGYDTVVARVSLAVDLHHESRGTHMSRFLAILSKWREEPISYAEIESMLADATALLQADVAQMELCFKYFMTKEAPVSRINSLMDYDVSFRARTDQRGFRFLLTVHVPVTALCPCSKEISAYGAHNQRALIHCSVALQRADQMLWIEDLVQLLELQGSAQLYPLLKREDEKYVTEYAYDHPKFVEDILRDAVTVLRADPRVHGFHVRVDSLESIHTHNVYATQNEGLTAW
jgi:GTP cyclohydrolase I